MMVSHHVVEVPEGPTGLGHVDGEQTLPAEEEEQVGEAAHLQVRRLADHRTVHEPEHRATR